MIVATVYFVFVRGDAQMPINWWGATAWEEAGVRVDLSRDFLDSGLRRNDGASACAGMTGFGVA